MIITKNGTLVEENVNTINFTRGDTFDVTTDGNGVVTVTYAGVANFISSSLPDNADGIDGDFYTQNDTTPPSLYVKISGTWTIIIDNLPA